MNVTIPCEVIVRLAHLIPAAALDIEPIFRSLRLENSKVIVTDRRFMAIEHVSVPFAGVDHIQITPALLQRCVDGATTGETITVICNPSIGFSMLIDDPTNIHVAHETTVYDTWYDFIVKPALTPEGKDNGAFACLAADFSKLAASSPSGYVVFESPIDCSRPMVIRDINSYDWCGFAYPRLDDGVHQKGATLPSWLGVK